MYYVHTINILCSVESIGQIIAGLERCSAVVIIVVAAAPARDARFLG